MRSMATPTISATGAPIPAADLDKSRRVLRWHLGFRPRNYVLWAIEERKSGRVIGMINYHRRDLREKRVDVGWLMLPALQGKGYMTEAGRALLRHLFDDLGVHKVEALIRPENKPSAALAKPPGVPPGGRADPRPLAGRRQVA